MEELKFFSNKSGKALITTRVAQEIYLVYKGKGEGGSTWTPTVTSEELARKYGITAKAIRDIWNKRTWRHATVKYWSDDEKMHYANNKLGRNKKTTKPAASCEVDQVAASASHPTSESTAHTSVTRRDRAEETPAKAETEVQNRSQSDKGSESMFGRGQGTTGGRDDGWLVCPSRIGMFISNVPEIEFKQPP
eukprot:749343-Hanusia_phi.AAC.7